MQILQTIFGCIQLCHVSLILWLTLQLYKYPEVELESELVIAEIVLSLIDVFVIRRGANLTSFLFSCSLLSSWVPEHEIEWVSILFLGKILYVNDILSGTKQMIFGGESCSFCQVGSIVFNFARFTLVEYMFLGLVIAVYKLVVTTYDKSGNQLPENYMLFYQMIVTATTIGYGDVCPKSRVQMNFFIAALPLICGSFVVYGNNVNPLWDDFLTFWNAPSQQAETTLEGTKLNSTEKDNLNEFSRLSAERRQSLEHQRQTFFNDWITLAALNYESQAELVHTVIDASFPTEVKLAVASKIRQEYFPANWTIMNDDDVDEELYLLAEGQVEINGEVKGKGTVFNHKGFFCKSSGEANIITKTFVTVWAISLRELQELGKNSPSVLKTINANIATYSSM